MRKPAEVFGRFLGGLTDDRHVQASADYASDFSQRHALVSDCVVSGTGRPLLQREPTKMSSIEAMDRRTAVISLSYICGSASRAIPISRNYCFGSFSAPTPVDVSYRAASVSANKSGPEKRVGFALLAVSECTGRLLIPIVRHGPYTYLRG